MDELILSGLKIISVKQFQNLKSRLKKKTQNHWNLFFKISVFHFEIENCNFYFFCEKCTEKI